MDKEILQALEKVLEQYSKKLLNIDEACEYINYKKSYVYQLTSKKEIPFINPRGKKLFFKKSDLDRWLLGDNTEYQKSLCDANDWAEKITSNISSND
jgi:excisionase family DNA binding protein